MHELRIQENRQETSDAHTLILEKPTNFTFKPGQYVLLQTTINERPLRRSYSIASAPHEENIHITIRTQPQGRVSPHLAKLTNKDTIGMLGPVGEFVRGKEEHSVFIAAGAGITPFISMLRAADHNNDTRKVTLLYTNKTPEQQLYTQELSELEQKNDWLTITQTITRPQLSSTNWSGREGRINEQDLKEHLDENTVFYLCGSNSMVRAFTAKLIKLQATPQQIRTENYGNVYA